MAINVNTVYTTVLSILNKEQRGYITPDEFNKLATQVQLEIFEGYFEDMNQQLRVPQTDNEYANRQKNIDDCISIFKTIEEPISIPVGAVTNFYVFSQGSGYTASNSVSVTGGSGTGMVISTSIQFPTFNLSATGSAYSLATGVATTYGGGGTGLTVNIVGVGTSGQITSVQINNPGLGYSNGDILTITGGDGFGQIELTADSNGFIGGAQIIESGSGYEYGDTVTIPGGDGLATLRITAVNEEQYFLPSSNVHRIGTVIYKDEKEIERIQRNDFLHVNMSSLTKPTTEFPVYIYGQASRGSGGNNSGQSRIYVYPGTITDAADIKVSYIRKPSDVVWGFTQLSNLGSYIYNRASSTQFELLNTEQTEVILRILAYAGVVIKDPQIIQAAASAVQAEEINSKS